jgi:serine/threonine protein kinase
VQSIFKLEGMRLEPTEALLVVVMEHCDQGSLDRAIRRRVYLPSPKWPLAATFRALLRTAAEISAGMEYIHAQGIVHGDMKPANILLKTHRADRRGYIAKVADFGLARHTAEMGIAEEGGCPAGTPAYLPPEAFDGPAAPACGWDVYAFGVILWVMWHCENPYERLHEAQVCAGVLGGWLRPEWKPGCPPAYRALAERCWAQDPGARPSFAEVSKQLVEIELEFRSQRHRSRSGSGSFAAAPAGAAMAVAL